MNYELYDVISFEKEEYEIISKTVINDQLYLYLINHLPLKEDKAIVRVNLESNKPKYEFIDSDEEFDMVSKKIFIEMKDEIKNVVGED